MGKDAIARWHHFPRWIKGPARIEGEEIVLDGGRAETYYINYPEATVFDLATLYPSHPNFKTQDVLRFVRQHGLLWHGPEEVGRGECRESLEDWWYAGARLSFIIAFYQRLMEGVETGSAEPVRNVQGFELVVPNKASGEAPGDDEYLMMATMVLANAINERLADCREGIVAAFSLADEHGSSLAGPGKFLYESRPSNLESAVYSHLAELMVARVEVKDCPGCGRVFAPESGKQKYCTKSCASTSRGRRFREKHRSGKV
jgi:hypothetical protein